LDLLDDPVDAAAGATDGGWGVALHPCPNEQSLVRWSFPLADITEGKLSESATPVEFPPPGRPISFKTMLNATPTLFRMEFQPFGDLLGFVPLSDEYRHGAVFFVRDIRAVVPSGTLETQKPVVR